MAAAGADKGAADLRGQLFGRYRLLDLLGVGGMAEVFLAKLEGIEGFERRLAIKRILPSFSKNESFVQMFKDEARLVSLFSHPNIVQIYDFGIIDGSYYISMEYVEGVNIADVLTRYKLEGKTVPVEMLIEVAIQTCRGLDYAHRETDEQGTPLGIIHRDITPHNIMLSTKGTVKITDFGIAKASSNTHMTQAGMIKGKVPYMSPEQAMGWALTHVSDIFAIGIVLYETATLTRLFDGPNDFAILRKVQAANIPSIRGINPAIPEELERIIFKALAQNREERYQWASELEQDLLRMRAQLSSSLQPFSLADFVRDFMERSPKKGGRPGTGAPDAGGSGQSKAAASRTPAGTPPPAARPTGPSTEGSASSGAGSANLAADLSALAAGLESMISSNSLPIGSSGSGEAVPLPEEKATVLIPNPLLLAGVDGPMFPTPPASRSGSNPVPVLEPRVEPARSPVMEPAPVAVPAPVPPPTSFAAQEAAPGVPPVAPSGPSSRVPLRMKGWMWAVLGALLLGVGFLLGWGLLREEPKVTGSLTLQVSPPDAEVRVNGELLPGRPPYQLKALTVGETVRIQVTRSGYKAVEVEAQARADRALTLPISLEEMKQ